MLTLTRPTFDAWMQRVDAILKERFQVSSDDLPDVCYTDMHDRGDTPSQAAAHALRYALGTE